MAFDMESPLTSTAVNVPGQSEHINDFSFNSMLSLWKTGLYARFNDIESRSIRQTYYLNPEKVTPKTDL